MEITPRPAACPPGEVEVGVGIRRKPEDDHGAHLYMEGAGCMH